MKYSTCLLILSYINSISAPLRHTAPGRHTQGMDSLQYRHRKQVLQPSYIPTHSHHSHVSDSFQTLVPYHTLNSHTLCPRMPTLPSQPSPAQSSQSPDPLPTRTWCNTRRKNTGLENAAHSHRWLHSTGRPPTAGTYSKSHMHACMRVCVRVCVCVCVLHAYMLPSLRRSIPDTTPHRFALAAPLPRTTKVQYMDLSVH